MSYSTEDNQKKAYTEKAAADQVEDTAKEPLAGIGLINLMIGDQMVAVTLQEVKKLQKVLNDTFPDKVSVRNESDWHDAWRYRYGLDAGIAFRNAYAKCSGI